MAQSNSCKMVYWKCCWPHFLTFLNKDFTSATVTNGNNSQSYLCHPITDGLAIPFFWWTLKVLTENSHRRNMSATITRTLVKLWALWVTDCFYWSQEITWGLKKKPLFPTSAVSLLAMILTRWLFFIEHLLKQVTALHKIPKADISIKNT